MLNYIFLVTLLSAVLLHWSGADSLTPQSTQDIVIEELPQGIEVRQLDTVRYHTASWTILVTIAKPKASVELYLATKQIQSTIQTSRASLPAETVNQWSNRLNYVTELLPVQWFERAKRAPLGFIGKISHFLFGTVTEDQLAQYSQAFSLLSSSVMKTVHLSNQLLSAVRQVEQRTSLAEQHLVQLRTAMSGWIKEYEQDRKATSDTLSAILFQLRIDRILTSLERAVDAYHKQCLQYKLQLRTLESLRLTREILPSSDLSKIRSRAGKNNYRMPSHHWLYSYVKIQPLWTDDSHLVYRATIPLYLPETFISYQLKSYPVPVSNHHAVTVRVTPQLSLSSHSEFLLQESSCVGLAPRVCRGGAIYDRTMFLCEQALIVGPKSPNFTHCSVKVSTLNTSEVVEGPSGRFVISTVGMAGTLHCPDKPKQLIRLNRGVHSISLKAQCRLRGPNWFIQGLKNDHKTLNLTYVPVKINVTAPFSKLQPIQWSHLVDIPQWTPLSHFSPLNMQPLELPKFHFNSWHATLLYADSSLWMALIIIVSVILLYYFRKLLLRYGRCF